MLTNLTTLLISGPAAIVEQENKAGVPLPQLLVPCLRHRFNMMANQHLHKSKEAMAPPTMPYPCWHLPVPDGFVMQKRRALAHCPISPLPNPPNKLWVL